MRNGNTKKVIAGGDDLPSGSALESAARYVARGADSSSASDGGGTAFAVAFRAFCEWGVENNLIRLRDEFNFLARKPDAFGQEHEVWFDEPSNRWFKATYENRFGLAWGRDGSATALGYLQRMILQNAYFGDDVHLLGLANCDGKLRTIISQPHIAGVSATHDEIQNWFTELGFVRRLAGQRIAWYLPEENLLVADAHEGNVIKTAEGVLVPIT
jgi:hypothetical protein